MNGYHQRPISDERETRSATRDILEIPLPDAKIGHVSRAELVRLLADGMRDMGFAASASALEQESEISSSSPTASQFLALLSTKQYDAALSLVDGLPFKEGVLGRRRA